MQIASIFNAGMPQPSRDELRAQMALLPSPDPSDVGFLISNADLVRDDYASAFGQVYDATAVGKRQKLVRYGVGVACGLVLGVVVGKLVL